MFTKIRNFIRFWKYNTNPRHLEIKSRSLVLFGCHKAFKVFKDDRFRELIKFSKYDQEEQNRFFNELVVTNLIMLLFAGVTFILAIFIFKKGLKRYESGNLLNVKM